jgi:serine protease
MALPLTTMKALGLQEVRRTSGGHILFRFAIPPGLEKLRNPITVAQELAKHAAVLFAQPNRIYTPDEIPNDILFPQQWHYFDHKESGVGKFQSPGGIGLPNVWEKTKGSRNVVVAVIDTGIVVKDKEGEDHLDFKGSGNLLPGFDFISDPKRANDGNGRDADPTDPGDGTDLGECIPGVKGNEDTWHGTSVASVIGVGKTDNKVGTAGVNWFVSVLPIRVSGRCGADDVDLYDAIKWAAGLPVPEAPPNPNPARVINISLGTNSICEQLMQEAVDEVVTKKGVSIVAGAGNNVGPAMFHSPSNCKHVIAVAASDKRGHLAQYSNFGPPVAIMAPGGKRRPDQVKVPAGNPKPAVDPKTIADQVLTHNHPDQRDPDIDAVPIGFSFGAGTSLAAPHVSGVLALWLAEDFSLTHEELLKGLQDNAIKRDKTQCPNSCGAGLLNADLSSLIIPGKAVPPPPLKKGPPPKEPPPVQQCTIKTTDIVHSLKIDIGNNDSQTTSAKQSVFRMLIHGDVETRRDASGMVKATENGTLAGIFQRNKGPVAARGQRMTPQKGWWELIPQGQLGLCLKEPAGEAPMIIYREQEMSTSQLDTMLRQAWHQCGLPALPFPCVYQKDLGNKPQTNTNDCLDEAEEAFLQGEQQCDDQFGDKKACQNAFKKCLQETGGSVTACRERVPCIISPDIPKHDACMNPVKAQRDQAKALCE